MLNKDKIFTAIGISPQFFGGAQNLTDTFIIDWHGHGIYIGNTNSPEKFHKLPVSFRDRVPCVEIHNKMIPTVFFGMLRKRCCLPSNMYLVCSRRETGDAKSPTLTKLTFEISLKREKEKYCSSFTTDMYNDLAAFSWACDIEEKSESGLTIETDQLEEEIKVADPVGVGPFALRFAYEPYPVWVSSVVF